MQSQELPVVVHNVSSLTTSAPLIHVPCRSVAVQNQVRYCSSYRYLRTCCSRCIRTSFKYAIPTFEEHNPARSSRHFLVICICKIRQDCAGTHQRTEIWLSTSFGFHNREWSSLVRLAVSESVKGAMFLSVSLSHRAQPQICGPPQERTRHLRV